MRSIKPSNQGSHPRRRGNTVQSTKAIIHYSWDWQHAKGLGTVEQNGRLRTVDDSRDDYLYPPECFEIVEENDGSVPVLDYSPPEEEREKRMLEMGVKDGSGNLIYEW